MNSELEAAMEMFDPERRKDLVNGRLTGLEDNLLCKGKALAAALAESQAELQSVTAERNALSEEVVNFCAGYRKQLDASQAEVERLTVDREELLSSLGRLLDVPNEIWLELHKTNDRQEVSVLLEAQAVYDEKYVLAESETTDEQ
tara:strand:- start:30850 stop:31284 length:435 start_codon:yes stop_codon:yes gene_type:complete